MEKNIVYYSSLCPDTTPFLAELNRLGIAYEGIDILERLGALKMFLRLRDQESAFAPKKAAGLIGIPVLHHVSGAVIFDVEELKNIV